MSLNTAFKRLFFLSIFIYPLISCYQPPHNNFQPDHPTLRRAIAGTSVGAVAGAVAGNTAIGAAIGGVAGTSYGLYKERKQNIIYELFEHDIQFVHYGDSYTLIVPTDKYFRLNSPRLNDICYPGLFNIVKLLKLYPKSTIYVAGFTDDIGSDKHKNKLSQAQAEAMLTYLWAHGIPAQCLHAAGYGEKHPVSDNDLIHGSAQNRRLEIQWFGDRLAQLAPTPYIGMTK